MALLTHLALTEADTAERFVNGAGSAGVYVNGRPGSSAVDPLTISANDPDQLDRLASELSSAAESLRLARIASVAA